MFDFEKVWLEGTTSFFEARCRHHGLEFVFKSEKTEFLLMLRVGAQYYQQKWREPHLRKKTSVNSPSPKERKIHCLWVLILALKENTKPFSRKKKAPGIAHIPMESTIIS